MKHIRKMILIGLCPLLLTGCGKSKETEEQQLALREQGMTQALEGDYEAAVDSYDQALQLAGMQVGNLELDIAAYRASALFRGGRTQDAIHMCSAILDLKKDAEIYLTRGLLYREVGDTQSANGDFAAALEMTSQKDLVMRGRLSYYMEDYANAKKYLEEASASGDVEAVYWQAELYWQMGNEDYAVTLYQNYLAGENPAQQSAYVKVAAYQIRQGDYDGALSTLEAGIARGDEGSLKELMANEIAAYEQKGDFETAKLKMESYLESYPNDVDAAREYEFLRSR